MRQKVEIPSEIAKDRTNRAIAVETYLNLLDDLADFRSSLIEKCESRPPKKKWLQVIRVVDRLRDRVKSWSLVNDRPELLRELGAITEVIGFDPAWKVRDERGDISPDELDDQNFVSIKLGAIARALPGGRNWEQERLADQITASILSKLQGAMGSELPDQGEGGPAPISRRAGETTKGRRVKASTLLLGSCSTMLKGRGKSNSTVAFIIRNYVRVKDLAGVSPSEEASPSDESALMNTFKEGHIRCYFGRYKRWANSTKRKPGEVEEYEEKVTKLVDVLMKRYQAGKPRALFQDTNSP